MFSLTTQKTVCDRSSFILYYDAHNNLFWFLEFPLGEIIEVVLGVKNKGETPINVTVLHGLLTFNNEYAVQNVCHKLMFFL